MPPTATPRSPANPPAAEIAVYTAAIVQGGPGTLLNPDASMQRGCFAARLHDRLDGIDAQIVTDFCLRIAERTTIDPAVAQQLPVEVRAGAPGTALGTFSLSAIQFDATFTQALVWYGIDAGDLGVHGDVLWLKLVDGQWRIVARCSGPC